MEPDASVTRLIRLLRDDDRAVRDMAASLIWQRYFRDLLDLARKNLDRRVRQGPTRKTWFKACSRASARQGRGEFDLADRDELWRLLVTITLRKARNAARDHHRDRRDISREQTLSASADDDRSCPDWALELMDASAPSPAEAAVLSEALERRLAALAVPELRQIALWRLEGYTNREIADQLDCTERSVERKLERIRSKWTSCDDGTGS